MKGHDNSVMFKVVVLIIGVIVLILACCFCPRYLCRRSRGGVIMAQPAYVAAPMTMSSSSPPGLASPPANPYAAFPTMTSPSVGPSSAVPTYIPLAQNSPNMAPPSYDAANATSGCYSPNEYVSQHRPMVNPHTVHATAPMLNTADTLDNSYVINEKMK